MDSLLCKHEIHYISGRKYQKQIGSWEIKSPESVSVRRLAEGEDYLIDPTTEYISSGSKKLIWYLRL